jgi:dihydroorotate dehydrogenase (fumarate)
MSSPDLSTRYLGLDLANPLVASSSPLTGNVRSMLELQEAGVSAIVLPSLFQEQVEHDELELERVHSFGAESFPEAPNYLPDLTDYNTGPDGYLELVERARAALSVPVIASVNGVSIDGWARYAKLIESAGASAIEMNLLFVPTDPRMTAAEVEAVYLGQVSTVAHTVAVPVSVKVGAHLSAPANFASRVQAAGADGLVLFNRFLEPDIDLETMEVVPRLELSHPFEMLTALRWIAIISARSDLSLAATGGVAGARDAIKLLAVGADAVMLASSILRKGPDFVRRTLDEMRAWLVENEVDSVSRMKGSMNHVNCPDPAGFERLNYMKALMSYSGRTP